MQTPKPRNGSEVLKRISPVTPKMDHPTKVALSDSDCTSPYKNMRSPNDKNLKTEHRSPRNLPPEKRRTSKVTELECRIIQLQQELQKTRDQLSSTEAWKRRAQQEVEEAKKELLVTSVKLEDSQSQLVDLSAAEETRLQELRKISHERDRAWQCELEAMQHQHSVDSAALSSAMNEIQRLKMQLDMIFRSEAARAKKSEIGHSELQMTRQNLTEALLTIENLKIQLRDSEKEESEAKAMLTETKIQLGVAQHTIETLLSDGSKLMESFSIIALELKESRSRVNSLEEIIMKVQEDRSSSCNQSLSGFHLKKIQGEEAIDSEVGQLISCVETMMLRYHEQEIESLVKLNHACELLEKTSNDNAIRESKLNSRLNDAKSEAIVLKASLFDKESELRSLQEMKEKLQQELEEGQKSQISQIQSELEMKLTQSVADASELKYKLTDKETTLQGILEENQQLKSELKKSHNAHQEAVNEAELARAAEKDALSKLSSANKEAEENSKKAFMLAEQMDAAQAIRSEMDAELRRLKVQSDQWRKAAEAAAVVLTAGTNGRYLRTGSLDSEYKCTPMKSTASPFPDDLDDESSWKRNNMVRRFRGMWKKEQKVIQDS